MRLFSRFQKQSIAITDSEVSEIQNRVRTMREQIGKRDIELADLFALVQEDERPVLREISSVKRPELERFWPDQIPSAVRSNPEPVSPLAHYSEWLRNPNTGLPTTP